jgi:3-hydroxyisobutyrate dehydrogenase
MAQNLQTKGKSLVVFDVAAQPIQTLVQGGAKAAATPKEVAKNASIVITMLPSNPHVLKVYTEGEDSLIKGLQKNQLFIDASTIDPNVAKQVQSIITAAGATLIDAPVSGGVNGAASGTLTFMVGSSKEDFERAKPILSLMGKNIVHCGPGSCGQIAKVCNNLLLGISMIGVSEAMSLGVKLGIDPKVLAGVINTSSGRCWSSDAYNPVPGVMENVPSSRDYQGGFAVDLMAKDLSLAISAANSIKTPLILGAEAHQVYNMLSQQGYGNLDFGAIYKFLSATGKK